MSVIIVLCAGSIAERRTVLPMFPAGFFAYATIFAVGGDPWALWAGLAEPPGPCPSSAVLGRPAWPIAAVGGARAADGPLFGRFIAPG